MLSRNVIKRMIITNGLSLRLGSEIRDIVILTKKVIEKKKANPILNPSFGEELFEIVINPIVETIAIDERMKLKSSYWEITSRNAAFNIKAARPINRVIFFIFF